MSGIENIVDLKDMIEEGLKRSRKLKEVYIKIHWKDVVGDLSKKSFPRDLKDATLTIICESSTLIHHMNLNRGVYIERINKVVKEDYVKELRFFTGSLKETEMKLFGGNDE